MIGGDLCRMDARFAQSRFTTTYLYSRLAIASNFQTFTMLFDLHTIYVSYLAAPNVCFRSINKDEPQDSGRKKKGTG